MPYRRESHYLWGPGIAGMKAGLYICLEAIRQITRNGLDLNLPVTLLIVSDKELGCPSSRELIEATASGHKYVLVPESTSDSQTVYTAGYAQQRYMLDVKVDTVSGELFSQSAISEMARHIVSIDAMSTASCCFKVGAIRSGQWVNFAETCTAEVISVAHTEADVAESYRQMMALNSPNPDKGLHVNRSVSLPLWQNNKNELFDATRSLGESVGLKLKAATGSGGSLATITGAMGIATLDGVGVIGTGAQSRAERIQVQSLTERARLIAGLLTTLR